SGLEPVRRILLESGFTHVLTVPEQAQPDPDFPTVPSPNPEERSALAMAIALAEREMADLVIATDPDADRMGLAIREEDGGYRVLSGNQIGLLLMDYILAAKKSAGSLPEGSFCVTTIVSTRLARSVAAHYGAVLMECLTGFKYIGELIKEHDENGDMHFQFGFEESYGYLSGTDVRDKDAVVAAMLAAEMAASARDRGLTLFGLLQDLYTRFGYAAEKTWSFSLSSREGLERIRRCMDRLRAEKAAGLAGLHVLRVKDYLTSVATEYSDGSESRIDLPRSDVLLYELEGMDWICVRPSGTEPKIKIYAGAYDADPAACGTRLEGMAESLHRLMEERLSE
nr:phospho-sugar mutase [Clostridia bacterium]